MLGYLKEVQALQIKAIAKGITFHLDADVHENLLSGEEPGVHISFAASVWVSGELFQIDFYASDDVRALDKALYDLKFYLWEE